MICALCKKDGILQESHFIQKSTYKRFNEIKQEGTSLIIISNKQQTKVTKQIKQPLLCADCEELFNKNGEDYFTRVAAPSKKHTRPPLLFVTLRSTIIPTWASILSSSSYLSKTNHLTLSFGPGILNNIESEKIYYYAISMFWRAGLDGWELSNKIHYEEGLMDKMREYLIGGDYVKGYQINIIPSFWAPRRSCTFPNIFLGTPQFSMYQFDLHLEKNKKEKLTESLPPIQYSVNSIYSTLITYMMEKNIEDSKKLKKQITENKDTKGRGL